MQRKLGPSSRIRGLRESRIREMTRIALDCGAINLSQGFPDFDPPLEIREAAARAVREGPNQYAVTWGLPSLRQAVAASYAKRFPAAFAFVDPAKHVTITCGVTEGIVAAVAAVTENGDEVLIVEPAHENYGPATIFAGGTPVWFPLEPPDYALDVDRLARQVTARTRAILLNTPHNPTGRVFTRRELEALADLAKDRDLLVITDEIYDRILYDQREHVVIASLPGMRERTITVGGLSKTFAMTGWRLGHVIADEPWSTAVRTVHDFTTICAPTPLQHAAVAGFALPESHFEQQVREYEERRAAMLAILASSGFEAAPPEGAYYVLARYDAWRHLGSTDEFARFLAREVGVAVVAGDSFWVTPGYGKGLVRFAFAKKLETLAAAGERLRRGFAARS
jgi:aspartate/methionine/tyrosine aminotransferase